MRNSTTSVMLSATLLASLGACQKYDKPAESDSGSVTSTIKADEKAWNEQFKARNLEQLVGRYADDAYFVAPGVAPAKGSTAIRKVYADALSDSNFSVSFTSDKVDVSGSGDVAYSRGRFTEKHTDPATNKAVTQSGSFVTVYRKQADGSWKVVEDFTAPDPGEPKPVEPGKPATRAKMVSFG